jgi:hypothetical protein
MLESDNGVKVMNGKYGWLVYAGCLLDVLCAVGGASGVGACADALVLSAFCAILSRLLSLIVC